MLPAHHVVVEVLLINQWYCHHGVFLSSVIYALSLPLCRCFFKIFAATNPVLFISCIFWLSWINKTTKPHKLGIRLLWKGLKRLPKITKMQITILDNIKKSFYGSILREENYPFPSAGGFYLLTVVLEASSHAFNSFLGRNNERDVHLCAYAHNTVSLGLKL